MAENISNKSYDELRQLGYKTYEELEDELKKGLRDSVNAEESDKAEELKRALLPDWIIYPKGNEVYEALEDVEITYMTFQRAPYTLFGEAILSKGERVKVPRQNIPEPITVSCRPIKYRKLHRLILSEGDRKSPDYNGYCLRIDTLTLNTKFKLIPNTFFVKTFLKRLFNRH